jgi:putative nucleotidyltransferase with HDIG domain
VSDGLTELSQAAEPRIEERLRQLIPELEMIRDQDLRTKCAAVMHYSFAHGNYPDPLDAPFLPEIAANWAGGVDHLRAVARVGLAMCGPLKDLLGVEVDRDHVLVAGLLHDISKWFEYEPIGNLGENRRSELVKMLPHPMKGVAVALNLEIPVEICQAIAAHTPGNSLPTDSYLSVVLHHADMAVGDTTRLAAGLPSTLKTRTGG